MKANEPETFYATSQSDWRKWLKANHRTSKSVWLVMYKKNVGVPSVSWSDAVDEALCFGWIDSVKKTLDHERSVQLFSQRKPKGTWSKINKEKVERLILSKKMTPAGLEVIENAKQNGSWNILDEVEELTIPDDLAKAFKKHKGSKAYFDTLSKSAKKMLLQWLVLAKRPETRKKRVDEIAEKAGKQQKPAQFV